MIQKKDLPVITLTSIMLLSTVFIYIIPDPVRYVFSATFTLSAILFIAITFRK